MDMPDDVVSIWNCTSYRAVFRVEFVWIVDTIPQVDIVITAKKDSTETQPSRSPTKKRADVSSCCNLFNSPFSLATFKNFLMTFQTFFFLISPFHQF